MTLLDVLLDAIGIESAVWLFLAAFMLHDFEEIIRIEPWMRRHADYLRTIVPNGLRGTLDRMSGVTASQFAVAVCFEFVVFIPVTLLAAEKGIFLPFLGFNVILLLHVFMHIGQALYARMLVPGVTTAVCITLPYSLFIIAKLMREGFVTCMDVIVSIPFGLTLVPILLIGHKLGEMLARKD